MHRTTELNDNLIHRIAVGDLLTRSAARSPRHMAVVDGDRRFTYAAFNAWVNRTAHGLMRQGYARGDALALMSGNNAEFLVTYFACAKLGLVCVPINLLWRHGELAYVLEDAKVKGVVVEAPLLDQLSTAFAAKTLSIRTIFVIGSKGHQSVAGAAGAEILDFADLGLGQPEDEPACVVDDNDPISYLYTSGTTSAPKGVVGSHKAIYIEALGVAIDTGFSRADRIAAMLPFFHTAQLNAFCTPAIAVGATLYALRGFDAPGLLDLIQREHISVTFGLPVMYRTLLDHQRRGPRAVSSLRLAVYA